MLLLESFEGRIDSIIVLNSSVKSRHVFIPIN